MVSATECLYIYQQLVLMLQELGMDDVVKSVEEESMTSPLCGETCEGFAPCKPD